MRKCNKYFAVTTCCEFLNGFFFHITILKRRLAQYRRNTGISWALLFRGDVQCILLPHYHLSGLRLIVAIV